ncbi:glycoside hydrolase family protein [Agaribacterium sp. ZY112]|uniref:glycoside hydrolase family protein n=1 Tax=Agaribacterium sp. ZY112 TaxID=3233574 RepID=UPI0035259624
MLKINELKINELKIKSILLASCLFFCSFSLADEKKKSTDDLNFSALIQPVSEDNILYDKKDWYNWGSSIVKGDDGKYHLFYAQMSRELGFPTWISDGVIRRAEADKPEGPYTAKEIVLQGRGPEHWDSYTAHNPWIQKYGDKYYLYHISVNMKGRGLNKEQMQQARGRSFDNPYKGELRRNQRIGVAVADSPLGPWQRFDQPQVEPAGPIVNITCNPAVTERPDGGYLMLVRGDMPNNEDAVKESVHKLVRHQAIALAPTPTGPWTVQEKAAVGDMNAEDPAVWYDHKRQRYYGLYHAFGYMGMMTSVDGLHWEKAKHHKVMPLSYKNDKGETVEVARMERPFVFIENGEPRVLTVSIALKDGESYSMFIPLKSQAEL